MGTISFEGVYVTEPIPANAIKDVAVLIPCYNEAVTIAKVIDDFKRVLPDADVYVYDNNSTDDTGKIAAEHGAIVRTETRQGKGNVARCCATLTRTITLWSTVMIHTRLKRRSIC